MLAILVTLQSAIEAELPFLRAEAEARMAARVTVYRKSGRQAQDESTGEESLEWLPIHLDLPFRLDFGSSSDGGSTQVEIGGVSYEMATAIGHVPALTDDLLDGDFFDVVSGESAGTVWSVVKAGRADQKTARRLPIVEESRPDEWGI